FVQPAGDLRGSQSNGNSWPVDCCPKIMNEQNAATGIYLKPGFVVTAAHLTANWTGNADLSVHIAGTALPANLVKQGEFEEVDLTLFSVDDQKLPGRVARIQTSLCQAPPWPGDPVIVVDHTGATRSHIVAPQILPFGFRTKFHTLIGDVTSTGNFRDRACSTQIGNACSES